MGIKGLLTLCALPVALFAAESTLAERMDAADKYMESEIQKDLDQKTEKQESSTTTTIITESEFSGNEAVDAASKDSLPADVNTEVPSNTEPSNTASAQPAESEANSQKEAPANTDVAENADGSDDSSSEEESEMSQEEAEAELAADMAAGDSTAADSTASILKLDMTTAFVPTESRRISGPYGLRTYRMHRGVDLGLCQGENRTIVAAFAGKVKLVRNQGRRKGFGKYVILDHGNGLTTLYAHLASWNVKVGDEVQAGDTIGIGGNTGRSFGAHLHFEIRYKGMHVDPSSIFNFPENTFQNTVAELDMAALEAKENEYQKELSKHRYYKVRSGDCLGKIARKYGISVQRLKQLNKIKGNMIRPGQMLRCS